MFLYTELSLAYSLLSFYILSRTKTSKNNRVSSYSKFTLRWTWCQKLMTYSFSLGQSYSDQKTALLNKMVLIYVYILQLKMIALNLKWYHLKKKIFVNYYNYLFILLWNINIFIKQILTQCLSPDKSNNNNKVNKCCTALSKIFLENFLPKG